MTRLERPGMRIGLVLVAVIVGAAAVVAAARAVATEPAERPAAVVAHAASQAAAAKRLRVAGNRLIDANGRTVRFHGVNRSGTEYACVQGWGIFDGPSDARSVRAIASWHVNAVRVPLNEHCWLGINGIKSQYGGANYRRAIVRYVRLLQRYGMYVELSLMWAAPGSYRATYQPGAPDADHAPLFWRSLAATFKNDPNVILAPWGETIVSARCFLRGGVCEATYGPNNERYRTAGMQQAVDVMRRAGYRGVIAIPGVNYANDLSQWLAFMPRDPLRQLIAEAHVYGKNVCQDASCFERTIAPVARRVPVIFGETGETYDGSTCGSANISKIVEWADRRKVGYFAWTWNTWGNCSALIADFYTTKPFSQYAAWVKAHYRVRRVDARLVPPAVRPRGA
jgi:endoglucanase